MQLVVRLVLSGEQHAGESATKFLVANPIEEQFISFENKQSG